MVATDVLRFLHTGKGQMTSDVKVYLPNISENEITEALEECVKNSLAERCVHAGLCFYFKKK